MISEGACDCDYGRKQIASSCNIEPMFIKCPSELKEKDLEIVSKFKYLNKIIRNCRKDKEEIKSQERMRSTMVLRCINDYLKGNSYPLSLINYF